MQEYLEARDLNFALARFNGWYPTLDRDGQTRIVMPATNSSETAYWQARAIQSGVEPRYASPYIPRGDSLIITYPLSRKPSPIVVVEGPMDALAASMHGMVGVATMGCHVAAEAIAHLAFVGRRFIIVPDRDAEEEGFTLSAALAQYGVRTEIRLLNTEKDLAEMSWERREYFLWGKRSRA